jgi:hypothetical protein
MNFDAVAVGSIGTVIITAGIVLFLVFKIKSLMNRDADRQK